MTLDPQFDPAFSESETPPVPLQRSVYMPWEGFGGKVWEWWHADTVQKEYEAVGKVPPTIEEIESGALDAIERDVSQTVKTAATVGFGLTASVVAGALLLFLAVRK